MAEALRQFGFEFNEQGELRDLNGDRFKFTTQSAYEELGDFVTEYIYEYLQERLGLLKIPIRPRIDPAIFSAVNQWPDDRFGFAFATPNYAQKKTILVLIHGSGAVRAGQWGRKLIVNENLNEGSQLPYIERAISQDWGVIVMNTNHNKGIDEVGSTFDLKFSETPLKHARNTWLLLLDNDEFQGKDIHVVAHSAGGGAISEIMKKYPTESVKSIILTDSWFSGRLNSTFLINFTVRTIDGYMIKRDKNFYELYAGSKEHDRTSATCINAAFAAMNSWDLYEQRPLRFMAEVAQRVRGGSDAASKWLISKGFKLAPTNSKKKTVKDRVNGQESASTSSQGDPKDQESASTTSQSDRNISPEL